jgi:uncharacterized membrane protein
MSMRSRLQLTAEVLTVCWLGTMAGFFFAFAVDVAPAMTHLDGPGYITTQQWINKVVRSLVFGAFYFGSAVLPFVAAATTAWVGQRGRALLWLVIAALYFGAVFWLTRSINIPINNDVATWQPALPPPNWAEVRDRWNDANLARTVAAMASFAASVALLAARGTGPRQT